VDQHLAAGDLPVVHAVTNDAIVSRPDFLEVACRVMRALGSRGALQLRAPHLSMTSSASLARLATLLAEEQARTGAWLIVTDRVDIALIARARGAQLTGQSMEASDASRVIAQQRQCAALGNEATPALAVGASVHSLEEAVAARLGGATWGVVSHVFGPRTPRASDRAMDAPDARDRSAKPEGTALVRQLVRYSGLPIVAIGGIVPQHVAPLRQLGVHGVAAIRGIWDAENAERAAFDYLSAYDSEVGRR
jgi:thiamine-phosphate diphosphorylase